MHDHIDSLMKKWNKSSALALELHLFCIKQLVLCVFSIVYIIPLHVIKYVYVLLSSLCLQLFPAPGALWSVPKQTAISCYPQWPDLTARASFIKTTNVKGGSGFVLPKIYISL